MNLFSKYRRFFVVVLHLFFIVLSYLFAFLVRFDMELTPERWRLFFNTLPFLIIIRVVLFQYYKLCWGIWRYVSMKDCINILKAVTLSSVLFTSLILLFFAPGFPRSVIFIDWTVCLLLVGGMRLLIRALNESRKKSIGRIAKRALIVGAGDAGEWLVREINKNSAFNYEFVGFLDDNPGKRGMYVHGIQVMGGVSKLPEICKKKYIEEVIVAIPSATGKQMQKIVELCREGRVKFKTVPSLKELIDGKAEVSHIRDVELRDLLGREEVKLDLEKIKDDLHRKRIMVTGAGGSIGSELARQIATFEPESLILFERAESSLYFIDLELRKKYPKVKIIAAVGDILNRRRLDEVIRAYSPEIIYHAAAYKHVPLMEENPIEAVENNVFGTENLAISAIKGGVRKFVFISTDKAVRPIGVMGMTKRISEYLLMYNLLNSSTSFIAVRFGNVIGSDGSVIPLFKKQIERREAITITHREVTRYFMLIPEAVQLVLQAGAIGDGGEIFMLDMGEPIKIIDLARNLITLLGLEPWKDVPIEFTGLRKGEKLHEELISDKEIVYPTINEKIKRVKDGNFMQNKFKLHLEELRLLVIQREKEKVLDKLGEIVLDIETGIDKREKMKVKKLIGQILLEAGIITQRQLEEALDFQKMEGAKIGESLIRKGYISELQLTHFLDEQTAINGMQH